MKVLFVCQAPRWESILDMQEDPPRCGGEGCQTVPPEDWEAGQVEIVCPVCQSTTGPNVSDFTVLAHEMPVAVGVLVTSGNKILGVSRKDDSTAFGLPGGKVDPVDGDLTPPTFAQTLRRAAIREFQEEVGVLLHEDQLEFYYQGVCEGKTPHWMVTFKVHENVSIVPASQVGEGVPQWVTNEALIQGPFGSYNRKLLAEM